MTVIQKPGAKELALNMPDFIIDTDSSILFEVKHGDSLILSERYVPDALNQVRTHRLGRFLANALWGVWCNGNLQSQDFVMGTFHFYVDGVSVGSTDVIFTNHWLKRSGIPQFLSQGTTKVTRPGVTEYLSILTPSNVRAEAVNEKGDLISTYLGQANGVATLDVSYDQVASSLGFNPVGQYRITVGNDVFTFVVDHNNYTEVFQFRYRNVFDLPESLSCVGDLKLKGAEKASTGYLYGVERKFDVRANDEYEVSSGVIFLGSEYKYWHDFMNTREAELLIDGTWFPILISKQNYEREFRKDRLKSIEFSFRFADPDQNGLL